MSYSPPDVTANLDFRQADFTEAGVLLIRHVCLLNGRFIMQVHMTLFY